MYSLGVDQLPVAMRGPQGLLCFFHKDYPWGFQKGGVAINPIESKATPYNKLSIYM